MSYIMTSSGDGMSMPESVERTSGSLVVPATCVTCVTMAKVSHKSKHFEPLSTNVGKSHDIPVHRLCFTLNNYTSREFDLIKQTPVSVYGIIGEEVGENGTPHLQGCMNFSHEGH